MTPFLFPRSRSVRVWGGGDIHLLLFQPSGMRLRERGVSMAEKDILTVRNMTCEEFRLAVEWAAREGWNPGVHDAECFYAADPKGFFLAEESGEPVGCLSAVAYDDRFGFAGFYIVKPEFRGRGVGRRLIQRASTYMAGRTVGNDAVVAQQAAYAKYGFRMAYRNIRYCGIASDAGTPGPEILDLRAFPFDRLVAYDRGLFPADRGAFLRAWITQPDGAALGYGKDGRVNGYGVIRKCRQGFKIGPLFADSEAIAETLLRSLAGAVPGETIFLDIPEPNAAAGALVKRHRMERVFETARMYNADPPALPLERIFGVTSFELG